MSSPCLLGQRFALPGVPRLAAPGPIVRQGVYASVRTRTDHTPPRADPANTFGRLSQPPLKLGPEAPFPTQPHRSHPKVLAIARPGRVSASPPKPAFARHAPYASAISPSSTPAHRLKAYTLLFPPGPESPGDREAPATSWETKADG